MMLDRNESGLRFVKMHGAGNDFVVIDSRGKGGPMMTAALAQAIGDRHRGVGYDQLAELHCGGLPGLKLDFWNSDGSRAGACGNATRCVADMVLSETGADAVVLKTARGALQALRGADGLVSVNMGLPLLDWQQVPLAGEVDLTALPLEGAPLAVGMGNPHCVFPVADAEAVDLLTLGPRFENDPLFPEKTNVEFISLIAPDHLRMRVWERGTGVTLACGSGACAAAVAAHRRGLTGRRVVIDVDGGQLVADWREDGVWLTGPVAYVFEGRLTPAMMALA
jgi:diaminopimelate epimerase